MTDARAVEALERVRRNSRRERTVKAALWVYLSLVVTASLVVLVVSLHRQADNSAKGRATLQIIKDATDPNSQLAQRGQQATAQAIDRIAAQADAIAKQRDQELLDAVRSGKPLVFGPTPTLPPLSTTTTTVQPRAPATTVPKG